MLKYFHLILRNLGRNKLRTTLTALAVVVLVAVYCIVTVVTDTITGLVKSQSSQTKLLVRERWVAPSRFPSRYIREVLEIDGIQDWTKWHFFMGDIGNGVRFTGIATRVENLKSINMGLEGIGDAEVAALARERTGALVGNLMMERMGWRVGQRFTADSVLHFDKRLEFKVVGTIHSDLWAESIFFREDYYRTGLDEEEYVNVMWLETPDVQTAQAVARKIQDTFANRSAELQAETESAGVSRISERIKTSIYITKFVAFILLLDMVIILANSIAMTVRERRTEMAILKVLGFQPNSIAYLVIGEAIVVGAISGLVGAGAAVLFSTLNAGGYLWGFQVGILARFPITSKYLLDGAMIGAIVGFVSSVFPAWSARKVRVAEVFSQSAT